jgi:hypothetical protein
MTESGGQTLEHGDWGRGLDHRSRVIIWASAWLKFARRMQGEGGLKVHQPCGFTVSCRLVCIRPASWKLV